MGTIQGWFVLNRNLWRKYRASVRSAVYARHIQHPSQRASVLRVGEYIGLFGGNIGLICGNISLFFECIHVWDQHVQEASVLRVCAKALCGNIGLVCGDIGLYFGCIYVRDRRSQEARVVRVCDKAVLRKCRAYLRKHIKGERFTCLRVYRAFWWKYWAHLRKCRAYLRKHRALFWMYLRVRPASFRGCFLRVCEHTYLHTHRYVYTLYVRVHTYVVFTCICVNTIQCKHIPVNTIHMCKHICVYV